MTEWADVVVVESAGPHNVQELRESTEGGRRGRGREIERKTRDVVTKDGYGHVEEDMTMRQSRGHWVAYSYRRTEISSENQLSRIESSLKHVLRREKNRIFVVNSESARIKSLIILENSHGKFELFIQMTMMEIPRPGK